MLAVLAAFVAYLLITGKLGVYLALATQGEIAAGGGVAWKPAQPMSAEAKAATGTNPATMGTDPPAVGAKTSPNLFEQPDTLERLGVTPWGFR